MRLTVCVFIAVSNAVLATGCPELAEPEPPPDPVAGFQLSVPFSDIRSLNDVEIVSNVPTVAYAVGTDGAVIRYDGETWSREESGVAEHLEHISVVVEDEIEHALAVGANGTVVYRGADGAWAIVPSGTTSYLFGVVLLSAIDGFIVGEGGSIFRWNGGQVVPQDAQSAQLVVTPTGEQLRFAIPENLKAVNNADGRIIAVGSGGAIYSTSGDPACAQDCWIKEVSGTVRPLANVHNRQGAWIPTTDGVLMRRQGDPVDEITPNWNDEELFTPAPVFLQDLVFEGRLFTVGLSEDIYEFDGGSWFLTRVAEAAEMRAIDGTFIPPPDGAPEEVQGETLILAVGGGGRVVRGPSFLSGAGEALLETRAAEDDFADDD